MKDVHTRRKIYKISLRGAVIGKIIRRFIKNKLRWIGNTFSIILLGVVGFLLSLFIPRSRRIFLNKKKWRL